MNARESASIVWIRDVAQPYLKGFHPRREVKGGLRGYRFARASAGKEGGRVGFFAGFLVREDGYQYLDPKLPECILFAFVDPCEGALHQRLVRREQSLFRSTHEYISWLTHHSPRFQFSERGPAALARHLPLDQWPQDRLCHYARNFLIEGLAWLVRSGLVQTLASEPR